MLPCPRLFIAAAALSVAFAAGPASAAEKWEAVSTTAMSITGNITIDEYKVTFENGESLGLRPVGEDEPGVFVVTPEANPTLLNGNKLCGNEPPTFLVFGRPKADGGDETLYLKVFDTNDVPEASNEMDQPGICASYTYMR
ncbi:hypothetical protein A7A08_02943 [Methyloligella halotolerans]|uniref:Lipoprotein n=1 Tax=Methyloligella halotolerans TaxID=1177755 RepID=A0A1E2RV57_9HYPH|nr:hypothetical protein [Methyloligella halotolerans]ODA66091.1 hypothetical protein A7A08_02943 [Methyloligella halotolerans]